MKASPLSIVALALAVAGCNPDALDIITPEDNNTTVITDDNAGNDIDTDLSDDDVTKVTFDRTVKVTFSGSSAAVTGTSDAFTVSVRSDELV